METEGRRYAMLNEDEEGNASEDDNDEGAFISLVISYHRGKVLGRLRTDLVRLAGDPKLIYKQVNKQIQPT